MERYDVLVLGLGAVGSAALDHLARRGADVLGLDRFVPPHERGSSHGETRILRLAYFEHPDYVPLLRRSYDLWAELEARSGERLYREVGLLQAGPGAGEVLSGIEASAAAHGLPIERATPSEARERFGGFAFADDDVVVLDRRAGFLHPETCVTASLRSAGAAGARARDGEAVLGWEGTADGIEVRTARATYRADRLVIAAGAWAGALLGALGLPLEVRRKSVFWVEAVDPRLRADPLRSGDPACPCFLFEDPEGVFYGFPSLDGRTIKVAEHTGGRSVVDPLEVDRSVDPTDAARVAAFLARRVPGARMSVLRHSVCLYTMTPDQRFIVDRHPAEPRVSFAAGLSGHGFKLAPVLGEALADLALTGRTELPIGFLGLDRPGLRPRRP